MGIKRVDHYDGSLFGLIGHTEINEETGEQKHYGIGIFDYRGKSVPNAFGGFDHMDESGYNCIGHTERFGNADIHTGIGIFDTRGRTEHYGDRDFHTDLDGIISKGYSSPGGSTGFHEFFCPHPECDERPPNSSDVHGDSYVPDDIYVVDDIRDSTPESGLRPSKAGSRVAGGPSPSREPTYHEWKESDSFLYRISSPQPRFSDNQVLLGITAAVTALVIATIFILSYWQEIRNFISRNRNEGAQPVVTQPLLDLEQEDVQTNKIAPSTLQAPKLEIEIPTIITPAPVSSQTRSTDVSRRTTQSSRAPTPSTSWSNRSENRQDSHGSRRRAEPQEEPGSGLDYNGIAYCSYDPYRPTVRCGLYRDYIYLETARCTMRSPDDWLCGPMGPNHGYDNITWRGIGRGRGFSAAPLKREPEDNRRRIRYSGGY